MNLSATIDNFLEMMSAERGASKNTLEAYRRDLLWANEELAGAGTSLIDTGRDQLTKILASMQKDGFAATSQARRLSTLRQFFQFLYAEGLRNDDPSGDLLSPRKHPNLPKIISEKQVDNLRDLAEKNAQRADLTESEHKKAMRLHTIVELLYATGLRISELVTMPVRIVRGAPDFLLVRGKGSKERMVPLSGKPRKQSKIGLNCGINQRIATVPIFFLPIANRGILRGRLLRVNLKFLR